MKLLKIVALGALGALLETTEAWASPSQFCFKIPLPHPVKVCIKLPLSASCDRTPTGVETEDYYLNFKVPKGLMPDPAFDKRQASIRVHRVKPVYENGKCHSVPNHAAVMVHGRTSPGSTTFDLRHPSPQYSGDPGGGEISLQENLARAGIDTFAPDLLGYGLSTRFEDGLDDPCNASLPAFNADGSCPLTQNEDGTCSANPDNPEGSEECCDKTRLAVVFPLTQQARFLGDGVLPNPATTDGLGVNPLDGAQCVHSSRTYFANPDVWARDIIQVIDDAIVRAKPKNHKVALIGNSFGGPSTARTLYLLGNKAPRMVNRVIFLSSVFNRLAGPPVDTNFPTEESGLSETELSTTFPLSLGRVGGWTGLVNNPPGRDAFCTGRVIENTPEELAEQFLALDPDLGAQWGGSDPENPTGLLRFPTFTLYGLNREVAATFTIPTLILHSVEDTVFPVINSNNFFNALTSVSRKALVQVECGSHQWHSEGCSGDRCNDGDPATTPYGQVCDPEDPDSCAWDGPYRTASSALIEWIKEGTFDGADCGQFRVNASGIANEVATPDCPEGP